MSFVILNAVSFVIPNAIGFVIAYVISVVIPDLIRDPCSAIARRENPEDGPRVKPGVTGVPRGDRYVSG